MNEAGISKIDAIAERTYTALEAQKELVRMRNMDLVLHCAAEIDPSTLLYLSVNGLLLGESDYMLLLFSENSETSPEQNTGHRLYERAFLYGLVDEVAEEILTGHYVFYPGPIDGRLVVLISFHCGLMQPLAGELEEMLAHNCAQISEICRKRYDLRVSVHMSPVVSELKNLSSAYHALLDEVTFLRYTGQSPEGVLRQAQDGGGSGLLRFAHLCDEAASQVSELIRQGGEALDAFLSELFSKLLTVPPRSVRSLNLNLQFLLERIYWRLYGDDLLLQSEFPETCISETLIASDRWEASTQRVRALLHQITESYGRRASAARNARMAAVRDYVGAHIEDANMTVASLARQFNTTPSALTGGFRRFSGMTLLTYIQKKRLEAAERMLRTTPLSVREISIRSGFGSVESMHRVFRKELGMTPGQVRKRA